MYICIASLEISSETDLSHLDHCTSAIFAFFRQGVACQHEPFHTVIGSQHIQYCVCRVVTNPIGDQINDHECHVITYQCLPEQLHASIADLIGAQVQISDRFIRFDHVCKMCDSILANVVQMQVKDVTVLLPLQFLAKDFHITIHQIPCIEVLVGFLLKRSDQIQN